MHIRLAGSLLIQQLPDNDGGVTPVNANYLGSYFCTFAEVTIGLGTAFTVPEDVGTVEVCVNLMLKSQVVLFVPFWC